MKDPWISGDSPMGGPEEDEPLFEEETQPKATRKKKGPSISPPPPRPSWRKRLVAALILTFVVVMGFGVWKAYESGFLSFLATLTALTGPSDKGTRPLAEKKSPIQRYAIPPPSETPIGPEASLGRREEPPMDKGQADPEGVVQVISPVAELPEPKDMTGNREPHLSLFEGILVETPPHDIETASPAPKGSRKGSLQPGDPNLEDLIKKGDLEQAAGASLSFLQTRWKGYTIRIGVYSIANSRILSLLRKNYDPRLLLLPATLGGKRCLAVLWGTYATKEAARQGLATVPTPFLKDGSRPAVLPLTLLREKPAPLGGQQDKKLPP